MAFEPSENPITNPTRESYTELRPFRFWCQKVLPLVYDDSLSYYELLCKVVDYLNKTMEDVDHMNTDIDTLYSNFQEFQEGTFRVYNELVAYVNAYFENLDVQEEINNKLDEMVTSGVLVTVLQPTIANEVSDWLENHITPTQPSIDNTLSVSGAGADALKTGQNFATPYSTTNAYKLGDYVLYNGNVYRCIEPIETGEAFSYLKWLFVSTGDEFTRIRNLINDNHDYENIINEKLSIDTNTRVIYNFSATNIDKEHPSGYVTAQSGMIKFNKAGDHAIIKLQNTLISKITLPPNSAIVGQVYICDSLGNIYSSLTPSSSSETSIEIPPNIRNSATIYINWFNAYGDRTAFPQYCFFEYADPTLYQFLLSKTNAFNAVSMFGDYGITKTYYFADCMTYAGWFSVNNQGIITINNASGGYFSEHRHIILQSRNIKSIRLNGTDAPAVSSGAWVENPVTGGRYVNWGNGASPEYNFTEPTEGYIYLNSFKDSATESFAKSFTIEYWSSEELYGNYVYHNSVRKPFVFNNKTAVFVGDSITRGYTSGSTITNNNYPKLFSDIVNLNYTNMGVGGASFTRVDSYPCIQDQLTEANKNIDFLFIAGGINDWQLGVNIDTFKNTITTICNYINQNFNSQVQVIWITPINNTDYTVIQGYAPICKVQEYRNALTEIVTVNDTYNRFSIVQGNTFNFPSKKGTFANTVFGDGLHPSESGYKNVYVPCLINALI